MNFFSKEKICSFNDIIYYILLIFLIGAGIRIVFFTDLTRHPVSQLDFVFEESDMNGNLAWSGQILSGDYAGKNTWHPNHRWMQDIAPLESWYKWWGGKNIFHQAPLYPYFLALLRSLSDNNFNFIKIMQHILGLLTGLLVFLITYFLFDKKQALIAGLLCVLYMPFLCFEFYFLRDFLAVHLVCWMLLFITLEKKKPRKLWIFLKWVALGLCILVRENFLLLLPVLVFLPFPEKESFKRFMFNMFIGLIGLMLVLFPLLIRNYSVKAPLLSLSNRAVESLIEGNAYDSEVVYMCLPDSMKRYLEIGEGKIFKTMKLIYKDYPDIKEIISRGCKKFYWLLFYLEPFNNINLYYFKKEFKWLNLLPGYSSIWIMGYMGLLILMIKKQNRFFITLFAVIMGSLMFGPVLARYRLVLIPFLIIGTSVIFKEMTLYLQRALRPFVLICIFVLLILSGICLDSILPEFSTSRDLENYFVQKVIYLEKPVNYRGH